MSMFSSISQFAMTLSLDNLQDDEKEKGSKKEAIVSSTINDSQSEFTTDNLLNNANETINALTTRVAELLQNEFTLKDQLKKSDNKIAQLEKEISLLTERNIELSKQIGIPNAVSIPSMSSANNDFFAEFIEKGPKSPSPSKGSNPISPVMKVTPIELNDSYSNKESDSVINAENDKIILELQGKLNALNVVVHEKEVLNNELNTKYSTVCDKFKETVSKLTEIKETFKQKCKKYDEEILQCRDNLNSKEFSYMTLQEKYNSLEKQSQQKDLTVQQLRTTVSEMEISGRDHERVCGDLELKAKDLQLQMDVLLSKNKDDTTVTAKLHENHQASIVKIEQLQSQVIALETECKHWKQVNDAKQTEIDALLVRVDALSLELAGSKTTSDEYNNLHIQFQEYKKRAQLALKQANSSITDNNNQLASSYESTIKQLTADNQTLQIEYDRLQMQYDADKHNLHLLEERLRLSDEEILKLRSAEVIRVNSMDVSSDVQKMSDPVANVSEVVLRDEVGHQDQVPQVDAVTDAPVIADVFVIGGDSDEEENVMRPPDSEDPREARGAEVLKDGVTSILETPSANPINSSQLFVVYQLQAQMESIRNSYIHRGLQCDELQLQIKQLQLDKTDLMTKNCELLAYLNRIKAQIEQNQDTKVNQQVINMEYMKTCIYRYMVTMEISEKTRLVPVISTLLQFTEKERESVMKNIQDESLFGSGSGAGGHRSKGTKESVSADPITSLYRSMFSSSSNPSIVS